LLFENIFFIILFFINIDEKKIKTEIIYNNDLNINRYQKTKKTLYLNKIL